MSIEKKVKGHKIVVVQSRGFMSKELIPVHTNVSIIHSRREVKYGEFDLPKTSQIILINSKVRFPYLTYAVKKIIGDGIDCSNPNSDIRSDFFDAGKYDFLVKVINDNKSKLEEIKSMLDADNF